MTKRIVSINERTLENLIDLFDDMIASGDKGMYSLVTWFRFRNREICNTFDELRKIASKLKETSNG